MTIDRRDALTMLAGAAVIGGFAAPVLAAGKADGLHDMAKAKNMRFGSAVAWGQAGVNRGSFANPAYAALLKRDCGLIVGENEMKWQAVRPSATTFDFARFDGIVAWAVANGIAIRGHNLLWHQPKWMPKWEENHDFGARPASAAARLLTQHIETVCKRYGTRITSYDVVNEAVTPADGTLYQTALSRAMGGPEATLDLAFRTARAAAPHAQLVYNDYMSWEGGNAEHRGGVLKLLEGFKARGVPVDALGVQSHLVTEGPDIAGTVRKQEGEWRRFLDAVTSMGYDLLITELDVRDNGLPAAVPARDRAVADYTRAYLDVTLAYPQLRDILAWGMSDRYSWIEGFEPRKDKVGRRPCPYDDAFAAKPMRDAIAAAIMAAPARRA